MYESFTDRARQVMELANQEAQRFNHEYIGTEHVLLGLIKEGRGVAANVLKNLDVDLDLGTVRLEIEKHVQRGPNVVSTEKLPRTPRAKQVVQYSMEEARHLNHNYVGTEHILLGLLREQEGVATQMLMNLGLKLEEVREEVLNLLGHGLEGESSSQPEPTLNNPSLSGTIRILDAATNRATEGLRVVEDFARFVLDDVHLTKLTKNLRHDLATTCAGLSRPDRHASRETRQDVGTTITTSAESTRTSPWQVCVASLERTKQSLRSLEEYSKIDSTKLSANFESLRYRLYTLERCLSLTQDSCSRLHDNQLCVLLTGQNSLDQFRKLAQQIISAGVSMIQLREKGLSDRKLAEQTRLQVKLLRQLAGDSELLILINDRPDIAAFAGADGVHLGQDDLCVKDARAIVGPRKLIGVSTHTLEQARTAVLDGANYLGAGPTFPSTTKSFDTFPGLDFLKQVAEEISLPTFAIGGIHAENLQQVLATGITRIAVSGAVTSATEPKTAAIQLIDQLKEPSAPADG